MKGNVFVATGANKLGNNVFYTMYGEQYARIRNRNPRNPRTTRQLMSRAKLSFLSDLAAQFRGAIMKGFRYVASSEKHTTYNEFVQSNYNKLTGSTPETLEIAIPELTIADGPVNGFIPSGVLDVSTPGSIDVRFSETYEGIDGSASDDEVFVYIYCPSAKRGILSSAADRQSSHVTVSGLPTAWSGLEVYVFGFAIGGAHNMFPGQSSQTMYCGTAELG